MLPPPPPRARAPSPSRRHLPIMRLFLGPSRRATSRQPRLPWHGQRNLDLQGYRRQYQKSYSEGDCPLLARAHPSRSQARGLRWLLSRRVKNASRLHITDINMTQTVPCSTCAGRSSNLQVPRRRCTRLASGRGSKRCDSALSSPLLSRHSGHQTALWDALRDGTLQCIHSGTDAVAAELKCSESGDFREAAPGHVCKVAADVTRVWARALSEGLI